MGEKHALVLGCHSQRQSRHHNNHLSSTPSFSGSSNNSVISSDISPLNRKKLYLPMNSRCSNSSLPDMDASNEQPESLCRHMRTTSVENKKLLGNNVTTTTTTTMVHHHNNDGLIPDHQPQTDCQDVPEEEEEEEDEDVLTKPKLRQRRRRKKKPRCLKVTMENFSTFCQQTSLHGWQYIAQKHTSNMKHVFWAIIVSLSMGTAALFLYNNTMDYLHATVKCSLIVISFHYQKGREKKKSFFLSKERCRLIWSLKGGMQKEFHSLIPTNADASFLPWMSQCPLQKRNVCSKKKKICTKYGIAEPTKGKKDTHP